MARLAGVSTRTVRHYHAIGLTPEPDRDRAGYRRYGGKDVIALVRVVRLRGLGMPLPQIAARVSSEGEDVPLPTALRTLADEIDFEIERLTTTRDQLREMAESEAFAQPVRTLTEVLRGHGMLGPDDELRAGEEWAAALLDALHPQGMQGILDEAGGLLGDPAAQAALTQLRQRFRELDGKTSTAEIDALVAVVMGVMQGQGRDASRLDFELTGKLLSERANRGQRRFLHRLRAKVAASSA